MPNSLFSLTCIPLNDLSANLRMVLNEKSSFVIGKFADVNVYAKRMVREQFHLLSIHGRVDVDGREK